MMSEAATETRYRVDGMDCAGCATKIDTAVRRMPGVADMAVSVTAGTMTVQHGDGSDLGAIERKVSGLGYTVAALPSSSARKSHGGDDHDDDTHAEIDGLHSHDHGLTTGHWWESRKGQLTIASGVAEGRAERAADRDRRRRLRRLGHLWRGHTDTDARPDRGRRPALHRVPLHRTLLADTRGADHRAQSPFGGFRGDRRASHRLSGLRFDHRPGQCHDRLAANRHQWLS